MAGISNRDIMSKAPMLSSHLNIGAFIIYAIELAAMLFNFEAAAGNSSMNVYGESYRNNITSDSALIVHTVF